MNLFSRTSNTGKSQDIQKLLGVSTRDASIVLKYHALMKDMFALKTFNKNNVVKRHGVDAILGSILVTVGQASSVLTWTREYHQLSKQRKEEKEEEKAELAYHRMQMQEVEKLSEEQGVAYNNSPCEEDVTNPIVTGNDGSVIGGDSSCIAELTEQDCIDFLKSSKKYTYEVYRTELVKC
jgi:hypothetical protein